MNDLYDDWTLPKRHISLFRRILNFMRRWTR